MIEPVDCIVCGKNFKSSMPNSDNMPNDGIVFQSTGNYGSIVFDPGDGTYLEINICDKCILDHKDRVLLGTQVKRVAIDLEPWDGVRG